MFIFTVMLGSLAVLGSVFLALIVWCYVWIMAENQEVN